MNDRSTAERPLRLTVRGAARRDQILESATRLFLEQGYDAVSVDEIIRVVGGSKTNLYKQFGGKEGLFEEVIRGLTADFLSPLRALDVSSLNAADGLRVMGATLMRALLDERHVAFQRLVLAVSGQFPALTRIWFDSGPQSSRAVIAGFIVGRQAAGEIRPADPQEIAVFFHDMIVTDPIYKALMGQTPDWSEIEVRIAAASQAILTGYGVGPAPAVSGPERKKRGS